jgi:hypothetical protein
MKSRISVVFISIFFITACQCFAQSGAFYGSGDNSYTSSDGKYLLAAKILDRNSFNPKYKYSLTDRQNKKVVWERDQKEGEAPCLSLKITDKGLSIILTRKDQLIMVALDGNDLGKIDLIKDAFNNDEKQKYMEESSEGFLWNYCTLWYFAQEEEKDLYIIKPYWGRRIIIDLSNAEIMEPDDNTTASLEKMEKERFLKDLEEGVNTKEKWVNASKNTDERKISKAAFLAGKMELKESIQWLKKLNDVSAVSFKSCGTVGLKYGGIIDRFVYQEFGVRSAVNLSLRRLGEKPGAYPCFQFMTMKKIDDMLKSVPYLPPETVGAQKENVEKLTKGMNPQEVLDIMNIPDYIDLRAWYYEIDNEKPYTLCVKWDMKGVSEINKETPPFWKSEKADKLVLHLHSFK